MKRPHSTAQVLCGCAALVVATITLQGCGESSAYSSCTCKLPRRGGRPTFVCYHGDMLTCNEARRACNRCAGYPSGVHMDAEMVPSHTNATNRLELAPSLQEPSLDHQLENITENVVNVETLDDVEEIEPLSAYSSRRRSGSWSSPRRRIFTSSPRRRVISLPRRRRIWSARRRRYLPHGYPIGSVRSDCDSYALSMCDVVEYSEIPQVSITMPMLAVACVGAALAVAYTIRWSRQGQICAVASQPLLQ